MKDEKEKQLLYDIQREKDSQKQVDLVKTFRSTYDLKNPEWVTKFKEKVAQKQLPATGLDGHKFAIGTEILFPTFEKLRLEGWVDKGPSLASMVHPIYKNVWLSYEQIADFEDTEVTITHQNKPGEYSIQDDDFMYDDWPLDLMNVVLTRWPIKTHRLRTRPKCGN